MGLLSQVFTEREATIIYTIPVSRTGALDKLSWLSANDGNFSVKSACYLEKTNIRLTQGETSKKEGYRKFWNAIWHLNTPNSVKHFIWRAINDILPTRSKLTNRKIIESALCPICQSEDESSIHIVWLCPASRNVWGTENNFVQKWPVDIKNFWELWQQMVHKLPQPQLDFCAFILKNL